MSLFLKDVAKEFITPEGKVFAAVRGVSLDFHEGQFHTLLGPSGCGKTTLLRMIAGFETPTRGELLFEGRRINDLPAYKRDFPMVFQSYALFPHMTVLGNITYGLRLKKLPADEIKRRASKIIELLHLGGQENKYPMQMSGGQQQRVALARALVMEPKIILFDEPLSNLDAKLRLSMRDEIRALQKRLGITAIYVTHDQEEAMAISDQIVILNHGLIEQAGAPMEIYQKPRTEFVARFLGCSNILSVEKQTDHSIRLLDEIYEMGRQGWVVPEKGVVVLRPDSFELSREGRHEAVVENATFLGSRFQYTLSCRGTKLSVDAPFTAETPALASGEKVKFNLRPDRLHIIQ